MKTIKDIANICGCSKQTINRVIAELNIKTELLNNKNVVKDVDVNRIIIHRLGNESKCVEITDTEPKEAKTEPKEENPSHSVKSENIVKDDNYILSFEFLIEQIKTKDKQIEKLQNENNILVQTNAKLIKDIEVLRIAETDEVQAVDTPDNNVIIVQDNTDKINLDSKKIEPKKKWYQFWK